MAKAKNKTEAAAAPATIDPGSQAPLSMSTLVAIVEATNRGENYFVSAADGMGLVNAKLIEVNTALLDPSDPNKAAARATPEGIAMVNESNTADNAATAAAPAADKPKFVIRTDVPLTSKRGRATGGTLYPFDELPVGGSFHVPATEKMPKPHKTLGSAVSIATRKYAAQDGYETDAEGKPKLDKKGNQIAKWKNSRVFSVRAVDASDPDGVGARVFRTA
jgi:hypothetical protein